MRKRGLERKGRGGGRASDAQHGWHAHRSVLVHLARGVEHLCDTLQRGIDWPGGAGRRCNVSDGASSMAPLVVFQCVLGRGDCLATLATRRPRKPQPIAPATPLQASCMAGQGIVGRDGAHVPTTNEGGTHGPEIVSPQLQHLGRAWTWPETTSWLPDGFGDCYWRGLNCGRTGGLGSCRRLPFACVPSCFSDPEVPERSANADTSGKGDARGGWRSARRWCSAAWGRVSCIGGRGGREGSVSWATQF